MKRLLDRRVCITVRHLLQLKKWQYIIPPTLVDLRCVAQRIHYMNLKGSESV